MHGTASRPSPSHPFSAFALALTRAFDRIKKRTTPTDEIEEIRELLESLPVSTSEFGMAGNRLQNAVRYLRSHEWGAAQWELRTLLGDMTRCLKTTENAAGSRPTLSRASRSHEMGLHWTCETSER